MSLEPVKTGKPANQAGSLIPEAPGYPVAFTVSQVCAKRLLP